MTVKQSLSTCELSQEYIR